MESKVKWVKLGDYIEQCDERNDALQYGLEDVRGVSNTKLIQKTKANMTGRNLSTFHVVDKNHFVFNRRTTRNGERLGLGFNDSDDMFIFTEDYVHFKIIDEKVLEPTFLYIFFLRDEFDRQVRYHSWGSATEFFNWEEMQRVLIPLPSLSEQQKVVNAWKAFREIKEQNEAKAAPLMQLCQSYIQELKHKTKATYRIGKAIRLQDETNTENKLYDVLGLNKDKEFMPTVANLENVSLKKYKVVSKGQFAFSGMQTGRDICIRISLYEKDVPALISPAYTTFTLEEKEPLLPEYMMLVFKNSEMDRLGWFYSDSSVRSNLDWNRFLDIEIPYVPLDVQRAIVNIYKCANEAKQIAAEADRLSREVCPALIQHVIHS